MAVFHLGAVTVETHMITYKNNPKPKGGLLFLTYILAGLIWLLSAPLIGLLDSIE